MALTRNLFPLRKIPRNKIEVPEFVVSIDYSEKEIQALCGKVISFIGQLEKINEWYLSHPFLRPIKLQRVPLLLRIHTTHHLQITREKIKKIIIHSFQIHYWLGKLDIFINQLFPSLKNRLDYTIGLMCYQKFSA